MLSPQKSDFIIGLLNAKVDWCCGYESSRKNCFKILTFQNQTLLQDDDRDKSIKWIKSIGDCIRKLTPIENIPDIDVDIYGNGNHFKLRRSRSTKYRPIGADSSFPINSCPDEHNLSLNPNHHYALNQSGSNTIGGYTKFSQQLNHRPSLLAQKTTPTTTGVVIIEKRKKIRERLLNFLKKRPPAESLREKGILKDENVFGCTLERICSRENTLVPRLVTECIDAIEKNDITADGIYRACGNLATVQRLRFEINQDNYHGIQKEPDVHVLTGLLKMFFRDLKEPLFPFDRFENLIKLIDIENREIKRDSFRSLIKELPKPNYHTLRFVLQHLLRVTGYSKQNRMHIQNLAIVFGPTLIRKMNDLNNLVFDMMLQVQQSQVIEFLLLEFNTLFD
ncbi:N-acetylglucosaminyl-phosphatidylinositol biosynthetic protein [Sarcoptes scabiei]|nr:N-acetylglucosaminyl-phosphatidylinositol biosynthetic protein [Sarcoptes scabiei]